MDRTLGYQPSDWAGGQRLGWRLRTYGVWYGHTQQTLAFVWTGSHSAVGMVGTGAVMCVPAHDTRDHAFAAANELPVVPVVMPDPAMDDGERRLSITQGQFELPDRLLHCILLHNCAQRRPKHY